jgi:hypothetical protein
MNEIDQQIIIGNLSTLIKLVLTTVGGIALVGYLGGDTQLTLFAGAIAGIIVGIVDAYYPNFLKIFRNDIKPCYCECAEGLEENIEEEYSDNDDGC